MIIKTLKMSPRKRN
ncbi:hypothetical protein ACWNF4_001104 [Escherichia coli]